MRLTRTIKLKLDVPIEAIKPTVEAFTQAFNFVCQAGWKEKDSNGVSLHKQTYATVRDYLPAQLACSARVKATEALKGAKTAIKKRIRKLQKIDKLKLKHPNKFYKIPKEISCPHSCKQNSIRYDARSYSIWLDRNEVSLLTINGRLKCNISVPKYFEQYLSWRKCSADLFIRNNGVFLHIVFENDVPDPVNISNYIGMDRGVNQLVVTSDNRFFGGGKIRQSHRRYDRLRKILRSVVDNGGRKKRGIKRHLKKIASKANRFTRDANHCISKQIIKSLPEGSTIIIEDLTDIRDNCKQRKQQRRGFHRWSFFQLEQFLTYKSASKGIAIVHVDARYTSKKCSRCGYIDRYNRMSQSCFKCRQCSFQLNADLNGSRNIKNNHLDAISHPDQANVNLPIALPSGIEQAAPF